MALNIVKLSKFHVQEEIGHGELKSQIFNRSRNLAVEN